MEPENAPNKGLWVTLGILALILIAGGFYYSYRSNTADKLEYESPIPEEEENETVQIIQTKHQYKNGTHTYVGEINLPTPCDVLNHEVVPAVGSTTSFSIAFTTSNTSDVCAQVITPRAFKVVFKAGESIQVSATLNGAPLRLNIFEVGQEEDLDTFEVFIKG